MPLLSAFRWQREADKSGPRLLGCLHLAEQETGFVLVSRHGRQLRLDRTLSLPGWSEDATDHEPLLQAFREHKLRYSYLAAVVESYDTSLHLLRFPGQVPDDEGVQQQIQQSLGATEGKLLSFQVISRPSDGDPRPEFSVLVSTIPAVTADRTHALIEALGARPVSLVTTGATVCNLACVARTSVGNEHPHAFLHVGALRSCLTIFMDEHLSFLREFRFGEADLLNALQESMQMDADEVRGLYLSGSFDIRTAVNPTLSPWLHQLGISFDFFERRHGRSVRACYLIGEGTRLRSLLMCVSGAIQCPTATWDPGDDIGCLQLAATPGEDLDDFLLPLTEACRVFTGESSRAV